MRSTGDSRLSNTGGQKPEWCGTSEFFRQLTPSVTLDDQGRPKVTLRISKFIAYAPLPKAHDILHGKRPFQKIPPVTEVLGVTKNEIGELRIRMALTVDVKVGA